jgi:hypothetical protein
MFIAWGVQCGQCGASTGTKKTRDDAVAEWQKMNSKVQNEDLPPELFHEQYGLTPEAIMGLRTMYEFAKPQIEVLDRLGMEHDMLPKTRAVLAWLIQQHTDYPEEEIFMLDGVPVNLIRKWK